MKCPKCAAEIPASQEAKRDQAGEARTPTVEDAEHADALVFYCKAFSKATEIASATMTGIDRYGFEMSAKTKEGPRPVRVAFAKPVSTPEEVRAALVAMVNDAKSRLG